MTQAALAREAGISASYLNLIEHNKRRIGGALLHRVAEVLGLDPDALRRGGDGALVAELGSIAAGAPDPAEAAASAPEFAARFPAWAGITAVLQRRLRDRDGIIAALADRLTHDPFLSENVHAMLSNITAIRATADILSDARNVPANLQAQFVIGIHEESVRLSDAASRIAEYLGKAATMPHEAVTAEEAVDRFLAASGGSFDPLDREAERLAGADRDSATAQLAHLADVILDRADPPLEGNARKLAESHLAQYASDALALPLDDFQTAARSLNYDPFALSDHFAQPPGAVFRRLATLARPRIDAPAFGLMTVTASGYPLYRKPLPDFALPRHGNACPLWPLYSALSQPGQPIYRRIVHDSGTPFTVLALAGPRRPISMAEASDIEASMLIAPEPASRFLAPPGGHEIKVGTSCRICTRTSCAARVEPYLLTSGQAEKP